MPSANIFLCHISQSPWLPLAWGQWHKFAHLVTVTVPTPAGPQAGLLRASAEPRASRWPCPPTGQREGEAAGRGRLPETCWWERPPRQPARRVPCASCLSPPPLPFSLPPSPVPWPSGWWSIRQPALLYHSLKCQGLLSEVPHPDWKHGQGRAGPGRPPGVMVTPPPAGRWAAAARTKRLPTVAWLQATSSSGPRVPAGKMKVLVERALL